MCRTSATSEAHNTADVDDELGRERSGLEEVFFFFLFFLLFVEAEDGRSQTPGRVRRCQQYWTPSLPEGLLPAIRVLPPPPQALPTAALQASSPASASTPLSSPVTQPYG